MNHYFPSGQHTENSSGGGGELDLNRLPQGILRIECLLREHNGEHEEKTAVGRNSPGFEHSLAEIRRGEPRQAGTFWENSLPLWNANGKPPEIVFPGWNPWVDAKGRVPEVDFSRNPSIILRTTQTENRRRRGFSVTLNIFLRSDTKDETAGISDSQGFQSFPLGEDKGETTGGGGAFRKSKGKS